MTTHFVAADTSPTVATIEPSIIKRGDIVESHQALIQAYSSQQSALLGRLQEETVGGRNGGFLSDADCVLERRKTSRMYLLTYGTVSGLTMGGLAFLAHVAGGVDGVLSLGGWMFGTGALTLALAWARHGSEFAHSPEGIAHRLIDAHENVTLYSLESQRIMVELEHESEERRQAAQAQAAQDARQQAELRIAEIETRRRALDAQHERRFTVQWQNDAPERPQAAIAGSQDESIDSDAETHVDRPTGDSAQTWRDSLLIWVASLYAEPGALTADGIIKNRVPWAARSAWLDADKAQARRVCCELRPALIVPSDGGRWRLRRELFSDADLALQLLQQRFDD